jgi:phosphoribosylformylglycinamidine synthase II
MLSNEELEYLKHKLGREPNSLELSMVEAEWSEHCSYKSSKPYLKTFNTQGRYVLIGPGYDAGVLAIDDMLITVHIESHNHPSAVEPYGGAATGVGGVIRDILSMGSRPIALLNGLRFGDIEKDSNARWLFKHVVRGIADYGNCIGVPTVAGEVEFDNSFDNYCLVDVACIGLIDKDKLVLMEADVKDLIIIAGNSTGKDGIHGASFASKVLDDADSNRSAVQIPDPFMGKLLIDATMECVNARCVKAIKDLGGGGLACCLSELADKLGKGMSIDLANLHIREHMSVEEIMISESQERMLYIVEPSRLSTFKEIMDKYEIPYSVLGYVTDDGYLDIKYDGRKIARIKASIVANAPIAERKARKPKYLEEIPAREPDEYNEGNIAEYLLSLLSDPSIASKEWVYRQYDHEVGLRTVIKPGYHDASVIRLSDNKFLAVKLDGNSKHCYLDPYNGAMGCFAEACRNVIAVGAEPIAMVDHLQFGSPEDEHVFYTFVESVKGLADYGRYMQIPCVGGKVSFYNETKHGAIKPTPVVCILGLIDSYSKIVKDRAKDGDMLVMVGLTKDEMGGSEYYEYIHKIQSSNVPRVDLAYDKTVMHAMLELIDGRVVRAIHDCSKGGFGVALAEMCINSSIGAYVNLARIPNTCSRLDNLIFSESHSRFLIAVSKDNLSRVEDILSKYSKGNNGIHYSVIGYFNSSDSIVLEHGSSTIGLSLDKAIDAYSSSIPRLMDHA